MYACRCMCARVDVRRCIRTAPLGPTNSNDACRCVLSLRAAAEFTSSEIAAGLISFTAGTFTLVSRLLGTAVASCNSVLLFRRLGILTVSYYSMRVQMCEQLIYEVNNNNCKNYFSQILM